MPDFLHSPARLLLLLAALSFAPAAAASDGANYVEIDAAVPAAQDSEEEATEIEPYQPELLAALPAGGDTKPLPGVPERNPADGSALSLEEALQLALESNPALAALEREQRAAYARKVQAGQLPNPEISLGLSDFLGTAEMRFFRSAETSIGISQLVERSCKRLTRCEVAEREGDVAAAELERARLDILLAVTESYVTAIAAQRRLELALEFEGLIQQVYNLVELKVEGGKAAKLDLNRSRLELVNARLEREQRERELAAALGRISSFWEGDAVEYASVEGVLVLPAEVPGVAQLEELLSLSPDLTRWDAEEELRLARLKLATQEARPDYTITGGVSRFEDTDALGFNVGISFPLRRHHKNEGQVMEAQEYLDQIKDLRAADLRSSRQQLTGVYARLGAAYELALAIEAEVLPAAQESFELTQLGYRYGKFTLLDVLDSQRILIDARRRHLEALADYQLASVALERLVARPIDQLDNPEPAISTNTLMEESHND